MLLLQCLPICTSLLLQRCKKVWGDRSKVITDLIDATDESTILEHNLYVRHPDSLSQGHWGTGRVTLVGDAAHPMRPASGYPKHTKDAWVLVTPPITHTAFGIEWHHAGLHT